MPCLLHDLEDLSVSYLTSVGQIKEEGIWLILGRRITMAPHSGILAWGIPGMAEPGGLPSMGSHRVGHD